MMYIIPKRMKEENKIISTPKIYTKDVATAGIIIAIFYMASTFVHTWLVLPYWVFAVFSTLYLIQSAKYSNPEKRKWEAIYLMLMKDSGVYFSLDNTVVRKDIGINEEE